jgi:hypothetical protein
MPVDPQGGGTWVAANDAGLAFALLNVTRGQPGIPPQTPSSRNSRGNVVRLVAGAASLDDVRAAVESIDASEYLPFRLLAWHEDALLEVVSTDSGLSIAHGRLYAPMLRTSSSLGDASVTGLRQALFERLLGEALTKASQDAFHCHSWRDRPDVSVFMSRADARTVSITTVEVYRDRIDMTYQDVDAPFSRCTTLRTAAPATLAAPAAPLAVAPAAPVPA